MSDILGTERKYSLCDCDCGGYDKDRARVAARHGISVSAAASVFPDTLVRNTI